MSVKMNVLAASKPHAMMSFMFSRASRRASSTVRLLRAARRRLGRAAAERAASRRARAAGLLHCTGRGFRHASSGGALAAAAHPPRHLQQRLTPAPVAVQDACMHACARMCWRSSTGRRHPRIACHAARLQSLWRRTLAAHVAWHVPGRRRRLRRGARRAHRHSAFSSSVIWMTSGTLNARCSHAVNWKGTRWPRCRFADDGPCAGLARAQCVTAGWGSAPDRAHGRRAERNLAVRAGALSWRVEGVSCSCPRMQTGFSPLDGTADSGCAAMVRCSCVGRQVLRSPRRRSALVPGVVLSMDWAPAQWQERQSPHTVCAWGPRCAQPGRHAAPVLSMEWAPAQWQGRQNPHTGL